MDKKYCLQCGSVATYKIPEGDNKERIVCDDCNYIHYQNPNIICGTLAIYDDKILFCKRAIEPQYGKWTLPAGFMEIGETMAEGAGRETLEEADAIATDLQLYCLFDVPNIGQVNAIYLANVQDGKFGVGIETLETKLLAIEDIPWEDIAFGTIKRVLENYVADSKKYQSFAQFPIHQETVIKKAVY